ncbi:MAG: hypothetical protein O2945_23305, partial [Planctomycetota bacterium]|nr:hypothetical protein [Planctomycetota bacterium]
PPPKNCSAKPASETCGLRIPTVARAGTPFFKFARLVTPCRKTRNIYHDNLIPPLLALQQ